MRFRPAWLAAHPLDLAVNSHNGAMYATESARAEAAQGVLVITTTLPERAAALQLARDAVDARLAACAQVDASPVASLYHWQGALCEDTEWRLCFKTTAAQADALHRFVAQRHPYAVPQWVVLTAQASPEYAAWVAAETQGAVRR